MAQVVVRSGDGLTAFSTARGHTWVSDESLESGGTDTGPEPPEMLLGALGSCIILTMKLYAQRKGWPLEGVEIALDLERFNKVDYPAYQGSSDIIHEIRKQIVLRGPLDEDQKRRLLEISLKCPVSRVLMNPVFFVEQVLDGETLPAQE
jgi:putative redox protein